MLEEAQQRLLQQENEELRTRVAQLERKVRVVPGEQAPAGGAHSVDAVLASVSDAFFALDRFLNKDRK